MSFVNSSYNSYNKLSMDSEAPSSSLCLFKETRTDLEPSHPGSVIQIQVPSTSTFSVRPRQQRRVLRTSPIYKDEDAFNKHCLASSSSFHFGKSKRHPRSFLWRVLQEGRVLELRCVDLSKRNREEREASFTLQLVFLLRSSVVVWLWRKRRIRTSSVCSH